MKRRTLLAAATTAIPSLAGCLAAGGTTEEYEECHRAVVGYDRLPPEIQREVDAALGSRRFATDRLLLAEAIDTDEAYVVVEGTPYEPIVETEGDRTSLELREADAVRLPEPWTITVENAADRPHEVLVILEDDDRLVEEFLALEPGAATRVEATRQFGTYELTGRALTGHAAVERAELDVSDAGFDARVLVTEDGVDVSSSIVGVEPCSWETDEE